MRSCTRDGAGVNRRRFVAGAIAVAAGGAASLAGAQDPRSSAAVSAARDWLLMTDHGDAAESHKRAGVRFRNAMSVADWQVALGRERTPRGAVEQRTLVQSAFPTSLPGVPEGEYALLEFRTSFAKQANAGETLTLEREADGTWRVVGYFIK
jgi:hypothetical protein